MTQSRRDFLKYSALTAGTALLFPEELLPGEKKFDPNYEVLKQKFALASTESWSDKTMSEIQAVVGQSFLDAPYKAHTLEAGGKERLIINLKEFDCVTFVENTLALSRCIKLKKTTLEDFKNQMQRIRYRGGIINGYPSRLHYFSDWIDDNENKGIVKNMTQQLGGVPFKKTIDFMSTHRDSYTQLKTASFHNAIKKTEAELNTRAHFYLPKENIQAVRDSIHDGDIIGITTSIDGLDITHTGMAVRFQGYLRFLHAPLSAGTIQITKRTIVDYLAIQEKSTGIMVARPLDPKA